ncbi:MAG TPA: NAD(P)-dependent oxidoreductase [Candidatus Krumholzibacteria bacterium]|nr:NAD(P)-dependent oxidoreductase [Candidatus Krumholzibacteria bacterium]HPD70457.1 NAD(P)-dependent oxidoreductase [Candidatus Krumholzibacteria bacterium]HRY39843.1 NAD(P)-dependent oxidoreductase [Candidatus Krumholzibacteria bacterium]
MQAGFIGLGNLGRAMAGRLRETGVDLTVWNRTAAKAAAFGGRSAAHPAELISAVPAVVMSLADSDAVELVLRGERGLLSGDCAGKLVIDTTTNHHAPVLLFHQLCRQKGARYVEAPVAGSVVPASRGELVVMASGEPADVEAARPLLDRLAATIHVLGAPGLATRMKLVNNLCLATFMAVLGEALATAEAAGIDRTRAVAILGDGAGKSLVLDAKRQKLLDRDWSPQFAVGTIHKDLHCLQDLAREIGRPQHLAGVVKEQYARLILKGRAREDFSAVYDVFREG